MKKIVIKDPLKKEVEKSIRIKADTNNMEKILQKSIMKNCINSMRQQTYRDMNKGRQGADGEVKGRCYNQRGKKFVEI